MGKGKRKMILYSIIRDKEDDIIKGERRKMIA